MRPLNLPWDPSSVPHILLDVNRECNISCKACYNKKTFEKTFDQIKEDYAYAKTQRALHSVTLVGGEPTLHSELPRVIRMLKDDGMSVILLTNGVKLTPPYLCELRDAGLDIVLLHVDEGQDRPDLPDNATLPDIVNLRTELSKRISEHDIEAGFVVTVYDIDDDKLVNLVNYVDSSPYAHFLLATINWNSPDFDNVAGCVKHGLCIKDYAHDKKGGNVGSVNLGHIKDELQKVDMAPFATLGSSASSKEIRWLCYSNASYINGYNHIKSHVVRSGLSDRFLLRLFRIITGRYMYYVRRNQLRFHIQLFLNSFTGGKFFGNIKTLLRSVLSKGTLYEKRFVFQQGPSINDDGTIVHCRSCPDATVVNGTIVPVCMSDGWIADES